MSLSSMIRCRSSRAKQISAEPCSMRKEVNAHQTCQRTKGSTGVKNVRSKGHAPDVTAITHRAETRSTESTTRGVRRASRMYRTKKPRRSRAH